MNNLISADRPIESSSDDQLERAAFAQAVGDAVKGWTGNDSLVIGLFGPWGSGKSSIKNMTVEWLETDADAEETVQVVEFNPWQFANQERLTTAFFDELGIALGKGTVASGRDQKRMVERWRRYARYLQGGGSLIKALRVPLGLLLVFVAVVLFGVTASEAKTIGYIGAGIALVAAAVMFWSSRVASAIETLLSARTEENTQSIEEVKDELSSELRGLDAPICVFLDDVDRLTPSEVQVLFQLIKVNADFPNLVYVILCERDTVEKHLESVLSVAGREYLEKIVQVGFDVPTAGQSQLDDILFQGLNEILSDEAVGRHFEKVRWGNLYLSGLQPYFTNLRQIKRYLATLSFHVSLLKGDRAFEANVIDLIGLEVLRVFEPDVYREIARNKKALTGRPPRGRGRTDDGRRDIVQQIVEQAPEERREEIEEVVKQLFPPAEWVFGGSTYVPDFWDRWSRELRVCSPEVFDRYFRLTIPEGDISQGTIEALIEGIADRTTLRQLLEDLAERNLLEAALDRLEVYKEEFPVEDFETAATALFDISALLSPERPGMFQISASMQALRIVYGHLKREEDEERRREMLRSAISDTVGLELPVRFVALEEQAAETEGRDRLVSDVGLEELQRLCVEKIRAAAEEGQLLGSLDLLNILYRWSEWDDAEVVRQFCEEALESPDTALQLAAAFLQRSTRMGLSDRVSRHRWYVDPESVERFLSLDRLREVLDNLPTDELNEEQLRVLEAVREASTEQ